MASDETGVFKDDEGNLYVDTDPDDGWSGSDAADRGDAIDDSSGSSSSGSSNSGSSSSSGSSGSSNSGSSSSSGSSGSSSSSLNNFDIEGVSDEKEKQRIKEASPGDVFVSESGETKTARELKKDIGADPDKGGTTLTGVEGEDGYTLTEDQLNEKIRKGETENLDIAENRRDEINTLQEDLVTKTEKEKQADVNLSGLQDKQGNQLTESEALKQIQKDPSNLELGPGMRTSRSAKINSRVNRVKQSRSRDQNSQVVRLEETGIDASKVERPENLPNPVPENRIVANVEKTNLYSTNRELAQGTDIPGESFFDRSKSATGIPGTGDLAAGKNIAFQTPAEEGFKVQQDVEDFLLNFGAPSETAESFSKGTGVASTIGFSGLQGAVQAPQEIEEFLEDPEKKAEETIEGLKKVSSGQVSSDPETAALLAGTDFQEQANLAKESFFSGIAAGGVASAGGGVASGGAVRGVNAPTSRFLDRSPDVEVESFQARSTGRADSVNTEVEGDNLGDQPFVRDSGRIERALDDGNVDKLVEEFQDSGGGLKDDFNPSDQSVRVTDEIDGTGKSAGVILDDRTLGVSEQPATFVRVNDPEGQRTFAVRTQSGFEATEDEVVGVSEADILDISEDSSLKSLDDITATRRVQDFRLENLKDEQIQALIQDGRGIQEAKDVEAAVFGEVGGQDVRGLSRANVKTDTGQGTVETVSSSKDAGLGRGSTSSSSSDVSGRDFSDLNPEEVSAFVSKRSEDNFLRVTGDPVDSTEPDLRVQEFSPEGDLVRNEKLSDDVRQDLIKFLDRDNFEGVNEQSISDVETSEGFFVDEEALESGFSKTVDFDERIDRPFTSRELTEDDLQDLQRISDELFEVDERKDLESQTSDGFDGEEFETGESDGQQLISNPDMDVDVEDNPVGVGVERVNREFAENVISEKVGREFSTVEPGTGLGSSVAGAATGTSVSVDTADLTGVGTDEGLDKDLSNKQDQGQDEFIGQGQGQGTRLNIDQDEGQAQDQDVFLGQDTEQEEFIPILRRSPNPDNDPDVPRDPDRDFDLDVDIERGEDKKRKDDEEDDLLNVNQDTEFAGSLAGNVFDLEGVTAEEAEGRSLTGLEVRVSSNNQEDPLKDL